MANKALTKYLHSYAEPECAALENFPAISPSHILVIPAFRETTQFAEHISATFDSGILIIVIINQPPGVEESLNCELMNFFHRHSLIWQNGNLFLFNDNGGPLQWLVVDRFTNARTIDAKQGVGLARKLGCDLAAAILATSNSGESWICSTDADATLPDDYFHALESAPADAVAAVFSVKHIAADDDSGPVLTATTQYERALSYYTAGLAWAGSPYAFPTVGSALAVRMQAYCECRGFPRKPGGEDFYLLNKLAKRGRLHWLKKPVISITARLSDRVPFGTGPAVKKILELTEASKFTYYAPEIFVELRDWLLHIPKVWPLIQNHRDPLENLPSHLRDVLKAAGIDNLWVHIRRQIDSPKQCEAAVHHWFDAFQTLKFIRRLQELHYPALPLETCLQLAPFNLEIEL